MSVAYKGVNWTPHKKVYDLIVALAIVVSIGAFVGVGLAIDPPPGGLDPVTLLIRATGVSAVLLLHVILAIGPVARLTTRAAPLLANRRHLGVMFFLVALVHAALVVVWYGSFGAGNPLLNVVAGYSGLTPGAFPFEMLGLLALAVFFLMAATSHDFWLHTLTPGVWKALHMGVYAAYALVVAHVALGALQTEAGELSSALLGFGVLVLTVLHIASGLRESARDAKAGTPDADGWIDVGPAQDIPQDRARVVALKGATDKIAVYRSGEKVCAVRGVCPHQGGPLGEGKVLDGCITCPWHGYQFRMEDGRSPPPFDDRVDTFDVRISAGRVYVHIDPRPADNPATPAQTETGPGPLPGGDQGGDAHGA